MLLTVLSWVVTGVSARVGGDLSLGQSRCDSTEPRLRRPLTPACVTTPLGGLGMPQEWFPRVMPSWRTGMQHDRARDARLPLGVDHHGGDGRQMTVRYSRRGDIVGAATLFAGQLPSTVRPEPIAVSQRSMMFCISAGRSLQNSISCRMVQVNWEWPTSS